ncbi:hypothetical protein KAI87_02645 [Myxococcota bacterium]|nr:hypothetical protein [Myxococcota bacterium]
MGTEYKGRSAAEAAIKACDELGVTRSQLVYEVLSESGDSPLKRTVVIGVNVEESKTAAANAPAVDDGPKYERSSRGDRDSRGGRGGRDRDSRGGKDRDSRGGRGGRDRKDSRERRPRSDRNHQMRDQDEGGIEELLEIAPVQAEREIIAAVEGEISTKAENSRGVLKELMELMKFEVSPEITEDGKREIQIDLRGADEESIIGDKGEVLLALQFLLNRMLARQEDGDPHVVLDAANYRGRRRDALADLATKLAARALEEKKVVKLSPMSAHDRRIFHITLEDRNDISTRSEGSGLYRPLLIIPEKSEPKNAAPETAKPETTETTETQASE